MPVVAVPGPPNSNPAVVYPAGRLSSVGRRGLQRSLNRAAEIPTRGLATIALWSAGPRSATSTCRRCARCLSTAAPCPPPSTMSWPPCAARCASLAHRSHRRRDPGPSPSTRGTSPPHRHTATPPPPCRPDATLLSGRSRDWSRHAATLRSAPATPPCSPRCMAAASGVARLSPWPSKTTRGRGHRAHRQAAQAAHLLPREREKGRRRLASPPRLLPKCATISSHQGWPRPAARRGGPGVDAAESEFSLSKRGGEPTRLWRRRRRPGSGEEREKVSAGAGEGPLLEQFSEVPVRFAAVRPGGFRSRCRAVHTRRRHGRVNLRLLRRRTARTAAAVRWPVPWPERACVGPWRPSAPMTSMTWAYVVLWHS